MVEGSRIIEVQAEECLTGGGEMGALMRAHDWSKTPVGPVASWPQSLRTAVSILLESGFPIYVAWGPEYTQFYNDGYRPILGSTKHPALGKGTPETFREIWDLIGPMFRGVRAGRATTVHDFMLPLDRHGFVEECYFIFSYSPIRDETGGVGGVQVTVTETTRRVFGERRTATLRDMAASAAEATSEAEAWRLGIEALARNENDVAFVAARLPDGTTVAPARLGPAHASAAWPVEAALRGETVRVGDAQSLAPGLRGTQWQEPIARAVALPVQRGRGAPPCGALVVGLSPRQAYDDDYHAFLEMAAEQLAASLAAARALEEERKRAEGLAELDRAKTAFFSNVSHEFRTPIALQLGPLEELLQRSDLSPSTREPLELVHRNSLRLLRLVNSLLDFSRIESGRMQASFEEVDLGAVSADAASAFRSAMERAGLRFDVDCPALRGVYVDRDLYEKALLNLVSNAFKFTLAGSVAVRLVDEGDRVALHVADTGIGIPRDQLARVFERFHRVEGAQGRTHEGAGIGLAFAQEIARLHGGTLTVESAQGRGSTFTLRIPKGRAHLPAERIAGPRALASTAIRADAFTAEAERWIAPGQTLQATPNGSRPRALVVDDNADMRAHLRQVLSREWDVELASDGIEALEALERRSVDIVLSDVMMPRLDGLGLVRAMRASSRHAATPALLLTARAGEDAVVRGLEAGADDYLVKPFTAGELVARMRSTLQLARARREDAQRIRGIFESITDAFYSMDTEWRLTYHNLRARAIFDALLGEGAPVLGQRLWDLFPPDSIRPFHAAFERAMLERTRQIAEGRGPDGKRWFEAHAFPSEEGLSVYFRDITDRKRNEARASALGRLSIRAGLATSLDDVYDAALEAITEGLGARRSSVLLFDDAGVMRFVADRGLSARYRAAVEGHSPWRPDTPDPSPILVRDVEAEVSLAAYLPLFREEGIRSLAFLPLIHDGRVIGKFMVYHAEPHDFPDDDVETARAIASTIGASIARRRAEDRQRTAQEEAAAARHALARSEKLSALGGLVSGVAHEIRTPLTIIENNTHLVEARLARAASTSGTQELARALHAPVEEIRAGVTRANRLVGELRRFTRLEVNRRDLVDVREAVSEALDLFDATRAGTSSVRASVEATPLVRGDRAQIQQIVLNLLHNAVDATRGATDAVRLRLEEAPGRRVRLVVEDDGVGMPPEVQARLYEPLFTTKPDGTGLGLSIVRRIVDEHAGAIECDSAPGKGTRFVVTLPAA